MIFNLFEDFFHNVVYYTEFRYSVNTDLSYFANILILLYNCMTSKNYQFERFIVLNLEQIRQERTTISQRQIGEVIGGKGTENPANVWQRILKGSKASGPQRLNMENYFSVAQLLGFNPIELLSHLNYLFSHKKR